MSRMSRVSVALFVLICMVSKSVGIEYPNFSWQGGNNNPFYEDGHPDNNDYQRPADLFGPSFDASLFPKSYTVAIRDTADNQGSFNSATIIDEQWLLTAAHVSEVYSAGKSIEIRFESDLLPSVTVAVSGHEEPDEYRKEVRCVYDIGLVRLSQPLPVDQIAPIASDPYVQSYHLRPAAVGGAGKKLANGSGRGRVTWAEVQLPLESSIGSETVPVYYSNQNLDSNSLYSVATYLSGDSGGGTFIRDGWGWQVAGVSVCESTTTTFVPKFYDWIASVLGTDLPTYTPTPKPTPDLTWTGSTSNRWTVASNWSGNGVPQFYGPDVNNTINPAGKADIVDISSGSSTWLYSGETAYAGMLMNDGILYSLSGANFELGSFFAGTSATSSTTTLLIGSHMTAKDEYVGFLGPASVQQYSGATNDTSLLVIGADNSGIANYTLFAGSTAPTIDADAIVVGEKAGSSGILRIGPASGSSHGGVVTVDYASIGQQGTGELKIESGELSYGKYMEVGILPGADGKVTVANSGVLKTHATTGEMRIGGNGTGLVEQTGGNILANSISIGGSGAVHSSGVIRGRDTGTNWTLGTSITNAGSLAVGTAADSTATSLLIYHRGDGSIENTSTGTVELDLFENAADKLRLRNVGTATSFVPGGLELETLVLELDNFSFTPSAGDPFREFDLIESVMPVGADPDYNPFFQDDMTHAVDGFAAQIVSSLSGVHQSGPIFVDSNSIEWALAVTYAEPHPTDPLLFNKVRVQTAIPGDANLDGYVDVQDYNIWYTNQGTSGAKSWSLGDFNGDGATDSADYSIWSDNNFSSYESILGSPAAVPEPSTIVLCWLIIGILARRCRG